MPPEIDPAAGVGRLTTALESGAVAVVLLQRTSDELLLWQNALLHLTPIIRRYDVALLLDNQPELAVRFDCDGVQIDDLDAIAKTRKLIGEERSLGFVCHASRHLAMEAGEAGVDYVAFDPILELTEWWASMMTLPCVSLPTDDVGQLPAFVASGVDFFGLGREFWADPRPNRTVMAEILALLASCSGNSCSGNATAAS